MLLQNVQKLYAQTKNCRPLNGSCKWAHGDAKTVLINVMAVRGVGRAGLSRKVVDLQPYRVGLASSSLQVAQRSVAKVPF